MTSTAASTQPNTPLPFLVAISPPPPSNQLRRKRCEGKGSDTKLHNVMQHNFKWPKLQYTNEQSTQSEQHNPTAAAALDTTTYDTIPVQNTPHSSSTCPACWCCGPHTPKHYNKAIMLNEALMICQLVLLWLVPTGSCHATGHARMQHTPVSNHPAGWLCCRCNSSCCAAAMYSRTNANCLQEMRPSTQQPVC